MSIHGVRWYAQRSYVYVKRGRLGTTGRRDRMATLGRVGGMGKITPNPTDAGGWAVLPKLERSLIFPHSQHVCLKLDLTDGR